ncbi:type I secretion protein [Antarctobacter sp.]|uniref:type I secretion protein n=1 Tax=Antarctobacter sp. TaxID=1872577 RepID=UPI002B26C55C|nr:type I secretion protein [Antarctobacter sp.]
MPILSVPLASAGEAATAWLFGGNLLAPRAPMTGPGSHAEAVEALGVTSLRYPGGSLTESFFDLSDPDSPTASDNETGEVVDFMPLSDAMDYAGDTGRAVTIVLPTREQISDTRFDDNGDRFAAVDEAELRAFVREVITGEYGDAPVAGFEIGNEYWGSGRMNAVEYGRVASEMTRIIDSELQALAPLYPEAAEVDILVQMGTNFGESSLDEVYDGFTDAEIAADLNATYGLDLSLTARIDWTEVNNLLVIEQFDAAELDAVDGIIAHVYSRGPDAPHTRYFHLDQIQDTWFEENPDLEIHVTEWNLRSNSSSLDEAQDYGLFQAQEMLEQVEAFMAEGVDAAQVWPLIQNTPSALSEGMSYSGNTPPGEMFALMSENLPGMTMLDFAPNDARETEYEGAGIEVHGFADGDDMLLYIMAPQGGGMVQTGVDLRPLVADVGGVEAVVLGVAPGQAPGDTSSDAVLERLDPEDVYDGGQVDVVLAEGEILQLRLVDVTPTASFAPVFDSTAPGAGPAEPVVVLDDITEMEPLVDPVPDAQADAPDPATDAPRPGQAQAKDFSASDPAPVATPTPAADRGIADTDVLTNILDQEDGQRDAPETAQVDGPGAALQDWAQVMSFDSAEPTSARPSQTPSGPGREEDEAHDLWSEINDLLPQTEPAPPPPTAADPAEAAHELLTLLGFAPDQQDHAAESFDLFSGPPDASEEPDEEAEPGEGFDDLGLSWALAALPLLAMAGLG